MAADRTTITFLGTGTSVGVPVIGCSCPVCTSPDPKNNRTRSSLFISTPLTKILVDTGPDLRQQALREGITAISAVLYTHSHLDHVAGFDELRAFCWALDAPLPLYSTRSTLDVLKNMYGWAFHSDNTYRGYVKPDPRPIDSRFQIADLAITPLPVLHGSVETTGFLFETGTHCRFAYLPDVKSIPDGTMAMMEGLDLLVIDSLRGSPHPTHLSVPEALKIIETVSPRKTLLTHMGHDLDHSELARQLPENVSPAYDGLVWKAGK